MKRVKQPLLKTIIGESLTVNRVALLSAICLLITTLLLGVGSGRNPNIPEKTLAVQSVFPRGKTQANNGRELQIRYGSTVLFRLILAGYDKKTDSIVYKLQVPKGTKPSTDFSSLNIMGKIFPGDREVFLPVDGSSKEISYRLFRKFECKQQRVSISLYFRERARQYYSLTRDKASPGYVLRRKVDKAMLETFEKWDASIRPFSRPNLDDCYLEIYIPRAEGKAPYFSVARAYLPEWGIGVPAA